MGVFFGIAGLIGFLGFAVKYLKWYWLISGYNTASPERKKQYDIAGLSRLSGNFSFLLAGMMVAAGVFTWLKMDIALLVEMGLVFLSICILLVKAQKFDGAALRPDGRLKPGPKTTLLLLSIFIVFIYGMLIYGALPTAVEASPEALVIKGMYGTEVPWASVREVTLLNALPKIAYKANGYNLGTRLKGFFRLRSGGRVRLFIINGRPPYIDIVTERERIILNLQEPEETRRLYQRIRTRKGGRSRARGQRPLHNRSAYFHFPRERGEGLGRTPSPATILCNL